MNLAVYWEQCCAWMRQNHYGEGTLESKCEKISYFLRWCEERALKHPSEITRPILERFQRYLFLYRKSNGEPLSIRTQWVRLVEVRLFFRWLSRQNLILYNPAADWQLPKPGHALPKEVLNPEEIERLLAVPDVQTPSGIRLRTVLEVLYSTGIRRMELAQLNYSDIDQLLGVVRIREGKGGKDRVVPISERALAWVQRYYNEVRPRLQDQERLFLRNNGQAFMMKHLSDMVSDAIDAAQLGKRGSCHMLRHSMATQMLEDGADVRYIQAMLGHESLQSTQIYTRVSIRKLKEVHSKTLPGQALAQEEHVSKSETQETPAASQRV